MAREVPWGSLWGLVADFPRPFGRCSMLFRIIPESLGKAGSQVVSAGAGMGIRKAMCALRQVAKCAARGGSAACSRRQVCGSGSVRSMRPRSRHASVVQRASSHVHAHVGV